MDIKELARIEDQLFCSILVQWKWADKAVLEEHLTRRALLSSQGQKVRIADVLVDGGVLAPQRVKSAWATIANAYSVCRNCGKPLPHFNAPAPEACEKCGSTDIVAAGSAGAKGMPTKVVEKIQGEPEALLIEEDTGQTLLTTDESGSHIQTGGGLPAQDDSGSTAGEEGQTLLEVGSSSDVRTPEAGADTKSGPSQTAVAQPSPASSGPASDSGFGAKTGATWPAEGGRPKAKAIQTEGDKKYFGNYEIVRELSRGGMGIVYIAKQQGLSREVALKVLIAGEGATEDQIKRFHREAEASAKLSHPYIVPIFDVGIVGTQHYFTMEFIKGNPLDALIKEKAFDEKKALILIAKTARALHYAHQHDIVHRDIKPGNILVTPEGEPKLTDFGLAKDVGTGTEGEALTVSGAVMGTPRYMSPEQAEGRTDEIGARSDLFSLAAIFYELLTYQTPFQGTTIVEILKKVTYDDPPQPRKIAKSIHKDVETICLKCLEKDMNKRYQTGEELAEDIDRFLAGDPILARPVGFTTKMFKKARKYRGIVITAIVSFILLLAAGGVFGFLQLQKMQKAKEDYQEAMTTGRNAFEAGEFDAAVDAFTGAKKLKKGDADAESWHKKAVDARDEKLAREREAAEAKAREGEAKRLWKEKIETFKANMKEAAEAAVAKDFVRAKEAIIAAEATNPPDPKDKKRVEVLKARIEHERVLHEEAEKRREISDRMSTAQALEAHAERLVADKNPLAAARKYEEARKAYSRVL
ncbi:MAG: serine/threonine-protein kinase, partial [Planctomycetota bacterium]